MGAESGWNLTKAAASLPDRITKEAFQNSPDFL